MNQECLVNHVQIKDDLACRMYNLDTKLRSVQIMNNVQITDDLALSSVPN